MWLCMWSALVEHTDGQIVIVVVVVVVVVDVRGSACMGCCLCLLWATVEGRSRHSRHIIFGSGKLCCHGFWSAAAAHENRK